MMGHSGQRELEWSISRRLLWSGRTAGFASMPLRRAGSLEWHGYLRRFGKSDDSDPQEKRPVKASRNRSRSIFSHCISALRGCRFHYRNDDPRRRCSTFRRERVSTFDHEKSEAYQGFHRAVAPDVLQEEES